MNEMLSLIWVLKNSLYNPFRAVVFSWNRLSETVLGKILFRENIQYVCRSTRALQNVSYEALVAPVTVKDCTRHILAL